MSKINYQIILIGKYQVGKNTLINKLCPDKKEKDNISLFGVDKINLDFNINITKNNIEQKINININLICSAGSERYKSFNEKYLKSTDGLIFLYDITDRNSFYDISNQINDINYIKNKNSLIEDEYIGENLVMMLIGNKLDLLDKDGFNREIIEENAKNICEQNDILWGGERSLKNIDSVELYEIMKKFVIKMYNQIGENNLESRKNSKSEKEKK